MAFIMLSMLFLLRGFLMPKPCCLAFEAFLNRFPAFFCKGKVLAAYDSTLFGSCEAFSLTCLSACPNPLSLQTSSATASFRKPPGMPQPSAPSVDHLAVFKV